MVKIRYWFRLIVVPAVLGLMVGVVTSYALGMGAPPGNSLKLSSALLTANRTDLALCIVSYDREMVAANAVPTVQETVKTRVSQHRLWAKAFGRYGLRVDTDCDVTPYLIQYPNAKQTRPIPRVDEASKYRAFIFVLSEEQMAALLEPGDPRVWMQEALCEEFECATVTQGVYVTRAELSNPHVMEKLLKHAVGLELSYEKRVPTIQDTK